MQKKMLNNENERFKQDDDRTTIRIGGLEISMTEEKRGTLIEKLSKWRDESTKLFICCLIAGLLSLIPFENAGTIVTKGQEWVQSIQVKIETNKQLKQERIEKEKAEKAIREAEKTGEIVLAKAKGMVTTFGMITLIISVSFLLFCLFTNNSENFSRAVMCVISSIVITVISLMLP